LSNSGVRELEINFLPTYATRVFFVAVQSKELSKKKKKKKTSKTNDATPYLKRGQKV
jgi:hypothetical protein